ncbi:hypothetical protein Tco_0902618 [Tanacetum coccineum]
MVNVIPPPDHVDDVPVVEPNKHNDVPVVLEPTVFCGVKGAVELQRWFEKTKSVFEISECAEEYDVVAFTQWFNELALMCPRMVEPERVKVDVYIRGLTDNIKSELKSSKPADLNKAVRMAHKLMEQKSQAKDERILEGKKRK